VRSTFGPFCVSVNFATIQDQGGRSASGPSPDLDAMADAFFYFVQEGNPGDALDGALVKRISGRDEITTRGLYAKSRSWYARGVLMVATNYAPKMSGQDHGTWRRFRQFDWNRTLDENEMDRDLEGRIDSQQQGTLRWVAEGAQAYLAEGRLPYSRAVAEASARFKRDSNRLGDYLDTFTEVSGRDEDSARLKDLYFDYRNDSSSKGERPWTYGAFTQALIEQLSKLGVSRPEGANYLVGIRRLTEKEMQLRERPAPAAPVEAVPAEPAAPAEPVAVKAAPAEPVTPRRDPQSPKSPAKSSLDSALVKAMFG
jgi:putative DNA primase/helicase